MTRGGGKKWKPNPKLQAWIDARKRHRLSDAQVQMARALGLNPAKLGKIDNHHQEQWKLPLPDYIQELYSKRFGRLAPENVRSIEEGIRRERAKREARRVAKLLKRASGAGSPGSAKEAADDSGTPGGGAGSAHGTGAPPTGDNGASHEEA